MKKLALILSFAFLNLSCDRIRTLGDTSLSSKKVYLSWTASPEFPVNSAGGGYRVYVGTTSTFSESEAIYTEDIPYNTATGTTQNSTILYGLKKGYYYFRVKAYSALTDINSGSQAVSTISDAFGFEVEGP